VEKIICIIHLILHIFLGIYKADSDTLSGVLLHDKVHIGKADIDDIKKNFGKDITDLVAGITKINNLNVFTDSEMKIYYYKKIIVELTEDIRIIIILLAERYQNMRIFMDN
jgi:GTP pyrophosphokinase